MPSLHTQQVVGCLVVLVVDIAGHNLRELGSHLLRGPDVLREGDRTTHGLRIQIEGMLNIPALGQPIPAADEPGGVIQSELTVLRERILQRLVHSLLVHREDQDLVIREHAHPHGVAEAQTVELRAVDVLIIH